MNSKALNEKIHEQAKTLDDLKGFKTRVFVYIQDVISFLQDDDFDPAMHGELIDRGCDILEDEKEEVYNG